jgi:PPM family protein phosphatase
MRVFTALRSGQSKVSRTERYDVPSPCGVQPLARIVLATAHQETEMTLAAPITMASASPPESRPRDDELDLFGLTHPGLVRKENEDQFLLCTVHPQVVMHATSLRDSSEIAQRGQRLATIMLVADGVGGSAAGSRASLIATEAVTRYVASSLRCYHTVGAASEGDFEDTLRAAAIEAHESAQ